MGQIWGITYLLLYDSTKSSYQVHTLFIFIYLWFFVSKFSIVHWLMVCAFNCKIHYSPIYFCRSSLSCCVCQIRAAKTVTTAFSTMSPPTGKTLWCSLHLKQIKKYFLNISVKYHCHFKFCINHKPLHRLFIYRIEIQC